MSRPRFWLHLTTGLTIDRRLSPAAKFRVAIAAALANRDPSTRLLAAALGVEHKTLTRAARELERYGLARAVRHPGRRLALHPLGLARPAKTGRQHYVMMSPDLFYAAQDAVSGRRAIYAPLIVQRLLREQTKRGAAHSSPLVLAADLDLKPRLVLSLLNALERAGVIERHRDHSLDTDELRVYSVPLAERVYPVDTTKLDPEQTRLIERVQISDQDLTVIGRRIDFNLLALRRSELDGSAPDAAVTEGVARAVTANLTGTTILAEDLLRALGPTLSARSPHTSPVVGPTLDADSPPPSKAEAEVEASYALPGVEGDEPRGEARTKEIAPEGASGRAGEEGDRAERLVQTARVVEDIFGYVPQPIAADLAQALTIDYWFNYGDPLNIAQVKIVDDFLSARLRALETLPDNPSDRFPVIRHAIKTAARHDDLYYALKAARPGVDFVDDLLGQFSRPVETD